MKIKNFTLTILSIFAVLLLVGFASAELKLTSVSESISAGEQDSLEVEFNLSATQTNYTIDKWISSPTVGSWNFPSKKTVYKGETESFKATLQNIPYDFIGTITADIEVNYTTQGGSENSINVPVSIKVKQPESSFCDLSTANSSNLELKVDIKNKGQGEDEEWNLLDTVEVEVELENDRDSDGENEYDLEDVVFELYLMDESKSDVADDMIWLSDDDEEFEFGDIDEGDDGKHVFEFRVSPEDIEEGNYVLGVSAYSDDDKDQCISHSEDLADTSFGSSVFYADIDVQGESDKEKMVIVDTESLPKPLEASCEGRITLTADVWNIGDKDFEDRIKVNLKNTELELDLNEVIQDDLDAGDKTEVTFLINVPAGLEEKTYNLYLTTFYDYDEDDEEYDEQSDEEFKVPLKIEGNCVFAKAQLSASLEKGGEAGENIVVKSEVVNSGSENSSYKVSFSGYESWANSAITNNTEFTLEAGESKEVLITLGVKDDVSGDKVFNMEVLSEGELIATQPIQVPVKEKTGLDLSENGALSILIGLIIVVLVAIIIVLAIKNSKK